MSSTAFLYFVILPVASVAWWCFICYVLSFLSGWQTLAARFRSDSQFDGRLKQFVNARLGWVKFNHALMVGANSEGLYLSMFVLFRVGMPPLLESRGPRQAPAFRLLGWYSLERD